jgi:hypothetical protein
MPLHRELFPLSVYFFNSETGFSLLSKEQTFCAALSEAAAFFAAAIIAPLASTPWILPFPFSRVCANCILRTPSAHSLIPTNPHRLGWNYHHNLNPESHHLAAHPATKPLSPQASGRKRRSFGMPICLSVIYSGNGSPFRYAFELTSEDQLSSFFCDILSKESFFLNDMQKRKWQ